ncbi:PR domain zinc finger protein 10-like isoform X2 [Limulus polyphemus]|uniref:PR domain zinc finger protein 10-like isoform X2 n=1 Tax=Limulus polyphemus TaxID=6850 RepID=A0ABM1SF39_LIMPO|nr:PR domain zinc finger protein 10-like isoform X2 [Limulus polyphemus]
MATTLPEPSSTSSPPPHSAASLVWPPHTQTCGEADFVSEGAAVKEFHEEEQHYDPSSRDIDQYGEPSNECYATVQVSTLPVYSEVNQGAGPSSVETSRSSDPKHYVNENNMIQDAVITTQPFSSRSHSPIINQALAGTANATEDLAISQHRSCSESSIDRVPITVEQLVLQHEDPDGHTNTADSLGLPLVLDRTNLAAIIATSQSEGPVCLDTSNLHRPNFSTSHLLQQGALLTNEHHQIALSDGTNSLSPNLMPSVLSQRELLTSMIPLASMKSSASHNMVSSFPISHKQMLAQKYAAEIERPETLSFSADVQGHSQYVVENLDDRISAHFAVTSGIGVLMDSQAVTVYPTHHSVSIVSTSGSPSFTVEGYNLERGAAVVSSSQENHEELMEDVQHYASTLRSESNGNTSVHSYVSSTVDLVSQENMSVDSTIDSRLHPSEDDVVDSTNNYEEQIDSSASHLPDSGNSERCGATVRIEEVTNCPTMSNENHPDSTHNNIEMSVSSASLGVLCVPSTSSKVDIYSDVTQSCRDLNSPAYWCEECQQFNERECPNHMVQLIVDKPVLSRAWASLPATYLYLHKISGASNESEYGVFAKKTIPKRTQFGPLEGVLLKTENRPSSSFVLVVEQDDDHTVYLDTVDESRSNWMRFVRPAETYWHQNLVLVQQGQSLYFNTTRAINPRTELRVWYSSAYAEKWGLPLLEMPEEERKALEDEENSWPCFECNKRFPTSVELQKHLNQHDEEPPQPLVTRSRGRGRTTRSGYCSNQTLKSVSETTEDGSNEIPVVKRVTRSRPPKKMATEEPTSPLLLQTTKRPRGRPPKDLMLDSKHEDFECQLCHKVFPRNYSLQRHMIMHTGEKRFKCPICEMKFSHVYNRNRHVRRHRQRGENEATPRTLRSFSKRRENRMWACSNCPLVFDNSSILNLHSEIHETADNKQEKTSLCEEQQTPDSKEVPETGDESNIISENGVCRCPKCKKPFTGKRALSEHVAVHGKTYSKGISVKGLINPQKPYKCNLCYKSFATDERLIRHYLVHGSDDSKPLQCDVCLKRFLNNSALACHIKVHNEDRKTYECPICKQNFEQMIGLKEHVHGHSENGLFTCPHCQKRCEEYNQIRKHIRAFHSERRYPCDKCDKVFPRPDKLKLHMLRHSNHREFLCADCGKQFKRKDKLKEHMKRMHGPDRDARANSRALKARSTKKFVPKVSPTDYHRFIYKCHSCLLGFKRRGMLVNHLARRHPDIRPDSVPELNLPILKTTRDYYCQYCDKIYKSSSKRKAHILKNHPGAQLPMSNRQKGGIPEIPGLPNPTFSQTVGSITTHPHHCNWCHKQYASKAKLLQHQRKKHLEVLALTYATSKNQQNLPTASNDKEAPLMGHIVITQAIPGNMTTSLTADGAIIIDATKRKLQFSDREGSPTADTLPSADLLTQAMSELTQSLNDYRPSNSEYLAARISQSSPTALIIPSSGQSSQSAALISSTAVIAGHTDDNTSIVTPETTSTLEELGTEQPQTITTAVLDQVQLAQLLAQYQQQPFSILATLLRNPSTQTSVPTVTVTTPTVTTSATTNLNSSRNWPATTSTFTEYPAH